MRSNVAKALKALVVLFILTTGIAYLGWMPYQDTTLGWTGHGKIGGNVDNNVDSNTNSGTSSSSAYPIISMQRDDRTYWEGLYEKANWKFVFGNTDKAGLASISWLRELQKKADGVMKNTDSKQGDEYEFNTYTRNALKDQRVAFMEEDKEGASYPDGRDYAVFVNDENNDVKILKVNKEDMSFDLDNLDDPYDNDYMVKPEAKVSEKEAKGLLQQYSEDLAAAKQELINLTTQKQPVIVEKVNETEPVVQERIVLVDAASGNTIGQQVTEPAPAAQTSKVTPYKSARSGSSGTSSSSGTSGSTSSSKKSVTPYKSART